jgi:V/A-type H+/Na+-transporting ATPase subunit E
MEGKLQELTEKLYKEGIVKAENEGKIIIENAREAARKIIENAEAEAGNIIKKAKTESENINIKTIS